MGSNHNRSKFSRSVVPEPVEAELAKVPLSVPTVTVEPDATLGKPVEIVRVPLPSLSVVNVPTVVPLMATVSELLAAASLMLMVSELVVEPCELVVVNVAAPLAEALLESVSDAVRLEEVELMQPPPDPLPVEVEVAKVPLSVPTVTVSPAATLVGKFDSDNRSVPAPDALVSKTPTVTPPIATVSLVSTASPVTLTVRLLLVLPFRPLTTE